MNPIICVKIHIDSVCGFSYLLIPSAYSFANETAVFHKIISLRYIESFCVL